MKKFFTFFIIFVSSFGLISCADMNNQDVGTITGGVAGGLIGSTVGGGSGRILAIAAGTLAGAFIGGSIGKSMDDTDRLKMTQALESNSINQPAYWHNTRTDTDYQVTPTRDVTIDDNQYCREYRTTAYIGHKKRQMYGTACRQPDGAWKAVS